MCCLILNFAEALLTHTLPALLGYSCVSSLHGLSAFLFTLFNLLPFKFQESYILSVFSPFYLQLWNNLWHIVLNEYFSNQ